MRMCITGALGPWLQSHMTMSDWSTSIEHVHCPTITHVEVSGGDANGLDPSQPLMP
jgi:hypothetical protein